MKPSSQSLATARLFRVYNHYRVVVGLILLIAMLAEPNGFISSPLNTTYLTYAVSGFAAVHVFVALLLFAGFQPNQRAIFTSNTLEVILIAGMLVFSSGVSSGLGNMLVITVAASNILFSPRLGLLIAALASITVVGQELYLVWAHGTRIEHVFRAGVLGGIYFATAILVYNLSQRVSASEELARKRGRSIANLEKLNHQIIQRMLTGIIVTDEKGQMHMANHAAMRLLGWDSELGNEQLPADLFSRMQAWLNNPSVRSEPFRGSSHRAPVQASFASLEKDEGQDIIIFLEDTGKINQQAQHLKLASLGRLTAGIAHEIRNPLGAASHAAQLLIESEELGKSDHQMAEIIMRHTQRMNTIIEDVLQLSRGHKSSPRKLKLKVWLEEFLKDFTAAGTRDFNISLTYSDMDIEGSFDPNHLDQVMTNLIANALRYSEKESGEKWAEIKVSRVASTDQALIEVRDKGPGITPEQASHLFEPFYTTDAKGTGLGLYLSRELCEANQAQLDLVPNDDNPVTPKGACFRITFPHPKRIL